MSARRIFSAAIDALVEAAVPISFSRLGFETRRRLFGWDDLASCNLTGRTIVVTGATSGLGFAAATRLASLGGSVEVVGRDEGRTRAARDRIAAAACSESVTAGVADLSSLTSTRRYASDVLSRHQRLDVLVHNAGALATTFERSVDGLEVTVAAHVVGPFLLTALVLPLLGATPDARVLTVSSGGAYLARLDSAELDAGPEGFDGAKAYARAKRGQVVLAEEWARRFGDRATFHTMHPGWADTPGLESAMPVFHRRTRRWLRTADQGADTLVWLTAGDDALATNGRFWLDRRPRRTTRLPGTATSPDEARRVWQWCEAHAGVKPR